MTWWVLTSHTASPTHNSIAISATTNHPDHLWLAWSYTKPAQIPIYRTIRGVTLPCGYRYLWDTPAIVEQAEPGDTLSHSLTITGLLPEHTIWYYLWAPNGPFGREIQGPLMSCTTLPAPLFPAYAYAATKNKGWYRTASFSPIGEPQPTWLPDNAGLPDLVILCAALDPFQPLLLRYSLTATTVYRHDNPTPGAAATATPLLTLAQVGTLTGQPGGTFSWLTASPHYPGHLYVVYIPKIGHFAGWCLKTIDYGLTWTAHVIHTHQTHYGSGNLLAHRGSGAAPFTTGQVLYIPLIIAVFVAPRVLRSLDEGVTWSLCPTQPPGDGAYRTRLHDHPTDNAILWTVGNATVFDLFATYNHGTTWALADAGNHLGIIIAPVTYTRTMATALTSPLTHRITKANRIWKTTDDCLTWTDQGPLQYNAVYQRQVTSNPDLLALGRHSTAQQGPPTYYWHVLFLSLLEGTTMYGKAGLHPNLPDGAGDSIPYNCGGLTENGLLICPP